MLMRHDVKTAKPINLDRCFAASDRQQEVSRRTQALLAAAGTNEPARQWFAFRVRKRQARTALEYLRHSGIETWMPTVMVAPRKRGKMPRHARGPVVPQERPVIAGLLLAKVPATARAWAALTSAPGYLEMLEHGNRPLAICDDEIDLFRRYLSNDSNAAAIVMNAARAGDQILITDGPLQSLTGRVAAVNALRGRAVVEVLMFGHMKPVSMAIAQIAKL